MRASEVFPEPLGPSTAQCWPASMVQSTPRRISTPSRRKDRTSTRATVTRGAYTLSVQLAPECLQPLGHQRAEPRQVERLLHPRIRHLIEELVRASGES